MRTVLFIAVLIESYLQVIGKEIIVGVGDTPRPKKKGMQIFALN